MLLKERILMRKIRNREKRKLELLKQKQGRIAQEPQPGTVESRASNYSKESVSSSVIGIKRKQEDEATDNVKDIAGKEVKKKPTPDSSEHVTTEGTDGENSGVNITDEASNSQNIAEKKVKKKKKKPSPDSSWNVTTVGTDGEYSGLNITDDANNSQNIAEKKGKKKKKPTPDSSENITTEGTDGENCNVNITNDADNSQNVAEKKRKKKKKKSTPDSSEHVTTEGTDGENSGVNITDDASNSQSIAEKKVKKKKKKPTPDSNENVTTEGTDEENCNVEVTDDDVNSQRPVPIKLDSGAPFSALEGHVCKKTLRAIEEMGFQNMTAIQAMTIPMQLVGQCIAASAKAGSGKTLAYLIPAIELLHTLKFKQRNGTGCIIITPTRELCIQTYGVLKGLLKYHSLTFGMVMGGTNTAAEAKKLYWGTNIVVATPGRLLYHLENTEGFMVKNLWNLVIDEVDKILQIGFDKDINKIIDFLPTRNKQTVLFSATFSYMSHPLIKRLATKKLPSNFGANVTSYTPSGLTQGYWVVPSENRFNVLYQFLLKNRNTKGVVFFTTRKVVQFYHDLLNLVDLKCMCLHGNQKQEMRTKVFFQFSNASEGILFSTNLAGRGIDIPDLAWVLQYDPPDDIEDYIHRVGRTARGVDGTGKAILMLRPEEVNFVHYLKKAGQTLETFKINPVIEIKDNQKPFEEIVGRNIHLRRLAREAYQAFVRTYTSHRLKHVFDVDKLDLKMVAKSFGLINPPRV